MGTSGRIADGPKGTGALGRFTLIDLTRVRAGPTCVRQLADFGANVIKVEMPPGAEPSSETMGGPRDGPDFQNLQRNKRSLTLDLKQPDAARSWNGLFQGRRAGGEFPARCERTARHRLRAYARRQSAPCLCQHFRFRPGWPLSRPARLRPDRARHGRADVDHRHSGARAGTRRNSHRGSVRGPVRRARHPDRAA